MTKPAGRTSWRRLTQRFEALRVRDLRFVFGASLASNLGDGIVSVALAFAVLDLTGSATDLGIIFAARMAAQVFVMLAGGVLADRVSRRSVMIAADLGRFCSQAAIGVLLIAHRATVAEIAASQVMLGVGSAFFIPASRGLLWTVAGEHAQEASALQAIAGSGVSLLGPALGGVLVATIGAQWAMVLDAVSYLLSAALLSGIARALATLKRDAGARSFLADLVDGFHEVRIRTWLWFLIAVMAVGNLLFTVWPVLAPLICKQRYGGAPAYAALGVAMAAGLVGGGVLLLFIKPRYLLRAAMAASIPWTVPGVLLGLHLPIYVVCVFQFIGALGISVESSLLWIAVQQSVPVEASSRVASLEYAATTSLMPLGYLLAGPLEKAVGVSAALIGCSAAVIVITCACFALRDVRMLERLPPGESALAAPAPAGAR